MPLSRRMSAALIRHAWQRQRWPLLVSALALLTMIGSVTGLLDFDWLRRLWTGQLDPLVSLATLLIAMLVWFSDARRNWLAGLPCKLTVVFAYQKKERIRCERADLASPADIRAMGQQLGRQMCQGEALRIALPRFQVTGGAPEEGADHGIYRHYQVVFELLELPDCMQALAPDAILIWRPPFAGDPEIEEPTPAAAAPAD